MTLVSENNSNLSSRQSGKSFVIYLVPFYAAWTFWAWVIYPFVEQLEQTTFAYAAVIFIFHALIFILPVFLYLQLIDKVNPLTYLKLKQYWKRGIAVGLILSIIIFLVTFLRSGPLQWNHLYITWNSILNSSIFVGFFEEVPFRGFILQKLQSKYSFWTANLISSLLFMGIHVPGYMLLHTLTVYNLAYVFIFGVVMAVIFYFSKSLWSSIVAHSLNDFLSQVIFHL